MPITIACPHCGASGSAPDHVAGQIVRCSKCKQSFTAGGIVPHQPPPLAPAPGAMGTPVLPYPEVGPTLYPDIERSGGAGNAFVDFLLLRRFVGPILLIILFWGGVLCILGFGLLVFASSFRFGGAQILVGFVVMLLIWTLGLAGLRLMCELSSAAYQMHDSLKEIRKLLEERKHNP